MSGWVLRYVVAVCMTATLVVGLIEVGSPSAAATPSLNLTRQQQPALLTPLEAEDVESAALTARLRNQRVEVRGERTDRMTEISG